ncbi:MAG: AraC family transcriptional regulator [Tannerella sp.]|jgi:AraC-like DNA-binding protein|nr:AraC family transcriptional regulator [Tannerella sp.]
MTVCLTDKNMREMLVEFPTPSFSKTNGLRESCFTMDNRYAKALLTEIKTIDFSIIDIHFRSFEDLKVYSRSEKNDAIWFCAALQGDFACLCEPEHDEFVWRNGYANLQSFSGMGGYIHVNPYRPFRMIEIMLSRDYLTKIAAIAPSLFDKIFCDSTSRTPFKAFPETVPFCPAIRDALNNILNYKWTGNSASLYLDAKIREILSLFLCRNEKNCDHCDNCLSRDRDKLIQAKEIIEQLHQSPPSLRELSLMIGTNECKLKNGFKTLFGTTVFGYLFNYRMNLTCRYLLDTDMTIQEIANTIGYEYHSHFTTAFKRKFHISPQEYRSRMKG